MSKQTDLFKNEHIYNMCKEYFDVMDKIVSFDEPDFKLYLKNKEYDIKYNTIIFSMDLVGIGRTIPTQKTCNWKQGVSSDMAINYDDVCLTPYEMEFKKHIEFGVNKVSFTEFFKQTYRFFNTQVKNDNIFNLFGDDPYDFFDRERNRIIRYVAINNEDCSKVMRNFAYKRSLAIPKIMQQIKYQTTKENNNSNKTQGEER